MLYNSIVFLSSEISDGNRHNHDDIPSSWPATAAAPSRPGKHVVYPRPCTAIGQPADDHARDRRRQRQGRRQHREAGRGLKTRRFGSRTPTSRAGASFDSAGSSGAGRLARVLRSPGRGREALDEGAAGRRAILCPGERGVFYPPDRSGASTASSIPSWSEPRLACARWRAGAFARAWGSGFRSSCPP